MPTIPREQPETHHARQLAESFGVDPERYDRARPRYPEVLVERIVAASPGPDMLDVGCGTGIEARQFRAAGCTVLGVDPDARMAGFARRGGIEVEVATFEAWDPAGRTFDAVVAGQSWHWVDPVEGVAKAARVLRPGGRLAVFGHVYDAPREVADAFAAVYRRVVPESPVNLPPADGAARPRSGLDAYQAMFARVADEIRSATDLGRGGAADPPSQIGRNAFGEPERWRFDWDRYYTRDEWLDLLPTTGGLTWVPPDKLAEVLDAVGAAVDRIGGGFTMPYVTLAVTAARAGSAR